MILRNQIILICLQFLISFLLLRQFISGIKLYQLNRSAYKKRKKEETLKEWFFCSRFKEEIPKIIIRFYLGVMTIHCICLITCIALYFTSYSYVVGRIIALGIYWFDASWIIAFIVLFNCPFSRDWAYDRWITKRRRK